MSYDQFIEAHPELEGYSDAMKLDAYLQYLESLCYAMSSD